MWVRLTNLIPYCNIFTLEWSKVVFQYQTDKLGIISVPSHSGLVTAALIRWNDRVMEIPRRNCLLRDYIGPHRD